MKTKTGTPVSTATDQARCSDCGHRIWSARSVAEGRGAGCRAKVRRAAKQADAKPESLAKAQELIADGGIVRIRATVFLAVSSDGSRVHRTAPQGCTCPAGLKNIHCYHVTAVNLLLAA